MNTIPEEWRPVAPSDLQQEMPGFEDWVLCGGHSVALFVGKDSRDHGDVDIGIFRSQAVTCLEAIGRHRVFLRDAGCHRPWDGGTIPERVHDIWIADRAGRYWAFQVMIYEDDGDRVLFRRDPRITWPKSCHSIDIDGVKIVNPFVTFLFKSHKRDLEAKEIHDLTAMIERIAQPGACRIGAKGITNQSMRSFENPVCLS
ncbi:MAG: hypothetical protein ACFCU3_02665 [Verrucomicrobiales bacterium]